MNVDNDRPVAVIAGATGALGHALSLSLAAQGWHIVALARSVKKLEQLDDSIQSAGGGATLVPFDLAGDLTPLATLGLQLGNRFGKIDALVLSAAQLGPLMPVAQLEADVMTRILQVNAISQQALLNACDPWLRKAANPSVTFVDCMLGADTLAYWSGYRAGKAALAILADTYAIEMANTAVRILRFDPGPLRGALHTEAFPGIAPDSLPDPSVAAEKLSRLIRQVA